MASLEYSRCTIPRLSTKMGNADYDKKVEKENKEDKEMEDLVKYEIKKRKKEKCKKRGEEIREGEQTDTIAKKRKIDEDGSFKKVLQMKKPERREEEAEDPPTANKRKKIENTGKFLGGVIKDAELEEVDWEKYREERKLEVEREEKARIERIEKAERLIKVWDLSRECRRFLKENSTAWIDHEHDMEKRKKEEKKQEQRDRARAEKEKFMDGHNRKTRMRTIREMLSQIPRVEAERIEDDVRRDERREFAEMKQNIWKKWRGKNKVIENKTKINDNDKIDRRILEIQKKLEEYKKRKEEKLEKRDAKKRKWKENHRRIVEDH